MKKMLSLTLSLALIFTLGAARGYETRWFTDSAGRNVEVPQHISRIACTGALAQIMLFALCPDYFVGVASDWSPSAREFIGPYADLPYIGQLYGAGDLSLEQIAALDPQVIIDVGEPKPGLVEDMDSLQQQLGIPCVHLSMGSETAGAAYRLAGELLHLEERAEVLAEYCDMAIARVHAIMERIDPEHRVTALYCLGSDGLNVLAKGSYHAQFFDLVCDNLAVVDSPSSKGTGNGVDFEQLYLWDPEFILFAPDSVYASATKDPLWMGLSAVASGRIAEVPAAPYNWMGFPASVQRILGALWLCDLFYPEQSGLILKEEVARYFDLFYHCKLTDDQYASLISHSLLQH